MRNAVVIAFLMTCITWLAAGTRSVRTEPSVGKLTGEANMKRVPDVATTLSPTSSPFLSTHGPKEEDTSLMAMIRSFVNLLNQLTMRYEDESVHELLDEITVLLRTTSRLIHRPVIEANDDDGLRNRLRGIYRQARKTYKPAIVDLRIREVIRQVIARLNRPQDYQCRCPSGALGKEVAVNTTTAKPVEVNDVLVNKIADAIKVVAPPALGIEDLASGRDFKPRLLVPRGRATRDMHDSDYEMAEPSSALIEEIFKRTRTPPSRGLKRKPGAMTAAHDHEKDVSPSSRFTLMEDIQTAVSGNMQLPAVPPLSPLAAVITTLQEYTRTVRGMNRRVTNITHIFSRILETSSRFVTGQLRDSQTNVYIEPLQKGMEAYIEVLRSAAKQIGVVENHLSDLRDNVVDMVRGAERQVVLLPESVSAVSGSSDAQHPQPANYQSWTGDHSRRQMRMLKNHAKGKSGKRESETTTTTTTTEYDYYAIGEVVEEEEVEEKETVTTTTSANPVPEPGSGAMNQVGSQLSSLVTSLQSAVSRFLHEASRISNSLG